MITFTIHWWLIPAIITVVAIWWAGFIAGRDYGKDSFWHTFAFSALLAVVYSGVAWGLFGVIWAGWR